MGAYVKNHILSAGLTRRFADEGDNVTRVVKAAPLWEPSERRRCETVGYRKRFFTDPEIARAAETRLNAYETRGLAALRQILDRWPLEDNRFQDRLDIASLVAVHVVRNPAFFEFVAQLKGPTLQDSLEENSFPPDQEERFVKQVTSEAFHVDHMLSLVPKMASLIASTHWTLLEFPAPLLGISDQPVTVVPLLLEGMVATVAPQPGSGFAMAEEFRMPIDPRHALLFTWANELDTPKPVLGGDDMAADLNRAGIAQCDAEWIHHPDRRPTQLPLSGVRTDECGGFGRSCLPGYGMQAALESPRRAEALRNLHTMIEGEVTDAYHVARIEIGA